MDGIACLIYRRFNLSLGALHGLLSFLAKSLRLIFEIVTRIYEVISCAFNTFAETLASPDSGLWRIKKRYCGPCANADAKG